MGYTTQIMLFTVLTALVLPQHVYKVNAFNIRHPTSLKNTHTRLGLYRKFYERGWEILSHDTNNNHEVPPELRSNSSPVKNSDSKVVVEIQSTSAFPFLELKPSSSVLRLARSAFLETQTVENEALTTPMTIHVLNFVIFPDPNICEDNGEYIGVPIFGADIVTLPGNKHLVAIDFQPVLPFNNDNESLFPERYSTIESKLKSIHAKYQLGDNAKLPWGGDIPLQAQRFFSPFALWTRLSGDDAVDKVNTIVWDAFQDYLNLYMDFINEVQKHVNDGELMVDTSISENSDRSNYVLTGQSDYIDYRRANDPARPMLQRLYGDDWTERVIAEILFPK